MDQAFLEQIKQLAQQHADEVGVSYAQALGEVIGTIIFSIDADMESKTKYPERAFEKDSYEFARAIDDQANQYLAYHNLDKKRVVNALQEANVKIGVLTLLTREMLNTDAVEELNSTINTYNKKQ